MLGAWQNAAAGYHWLIFRGQHGSDCSWDHLADEGKPAHKVGAIAIMSRFTEFKWSERAVVLRGGRQQRWDGKTLVLSLQARS